MKIQPILVRGLAHGVLDITLNLNKKEGNSKWKKQFKVKIKLMFRLTRERATTAAKLLALEISHEYKSETKQIHNQQRRNVPTSGMPSASIEMEFYGQAQKHTTC